jgi:hypothetical protein
MGAHFAERLRHPVCGADNGIFRSEKLRVAKKAIDIALQ